MLFGQWQASDTCVLARTCESEDGQCFCLDHIYPPDLKSWRLHPDGLGGWSYTYIFCSRAFLVALSYLKERREVFLHAEDGRVGGNMKEEEESGGRECIYSKNNLLSHFQLSSCYYWGRERNNDARRELFFFLSLSQASCWQALPRSHFSLARVCESLGGWAQGWVAKQYCSQSPAPLPTLPKSLFPKHLVMSSERRARIGCPIRLWARFHRSWAPQPPSHRALWGHHHFSTVFTQALPSDDSKCYRDIFKINILFSLINLHPKHATPVL